MKRLAILICLTFLLTTDAHSWSLFGPKNYEDCIIDGLKGVTSNVAAREIKKACREKFPTEIQIIRSKSKPLSNPARMILINIVREPDFHSKTISIGYPSKTDLVLLVRNIDKNVTITELTIRVNFSSKSRDYRLSGIH